MKRTQFLVVGDHPIARAGELCNNLTEAALKVQELKNLDFENVAIKNHAGEYVTPVKVEFYVSQEDAALVWSDQTWRGKDPRDVSAIAAGVFQNIAEVTRKGSPDIGKELAAFQTAFPQ